MNWLTPFHYDTMLTAMWTSALIGCVCGVLSELVTPMGWTLMGDALSYAVVPGGNPPKNNAQCSSKERATGNKRAFA